MIPGVSHRYSTGSPKASHSCRNRGVPDEVVERAPLPDLTVHVDRVIASADEVVGVWRVAGTHQGTLFGYEATGQRLEWSNASIFTVRDGQDRRLCRGVGSPRGRAGHGRARPDGRLAAAHGRPARCRSRRPQLLGEHVFFHLPGRREREFVDNTDPRHLVAGHVLAAPRGQALLADLRRHPQLDESDRYLPAARVGDAHNAAALDVGMVRQQDLDLGGEHAHAVNLEHFPAAAEKVQASVVVDHADVPGVQPPGPQRSRRGLRIAPVPVEQRRGADADLALLAQRDERTGIEADDLQLGAWHRQPAEHRPGAQVPVAVVHAGHEGVDGMGLGHPVGPLAQHAAAPGRGGMRAPLRQLASDPKVASGHRCSQWGVPYTDTREGTG